MWRGSVREHHTGSALRGDSAALVRLLGRRTDTAAPGEEDTTAAAFAATSCEEQAFPWTGQASRGQRRWEAAAGLRGVSYPQLAPFGRATVRRASNLQLCLPWPAPNRATAVLDATPPTTPTLILSGMQDLRTLPSDSLALAARLPGATLVKVPARGHSVLTSARVGCAECAAASFVSNRPTGSACRHLSPLVGLDPVAPTRLSRLAPAPGSHGRGGRTARAVTLTIRDLGQTLRKEAADENIDLSAPLTEGGLRGGTFTISDGRAHLQHFTYVPGVAVTGVLRLGGRRRLGAVLVTGSSAGHGRVSLFADGHLERRLGSRHVHTAPAHAFELAPAWRDMGSLPIQGCPANADNCSCTPLRK